MSRRTPPDDAPGTELAVRPPADVATIDVDPAAVLRVASHRQAVRLPHVWAGATGAAGTLAWGAAEATAALGAPGLIATAVTGAVTTCTAGAAWVARRTRVAPEWRARFAAGLGASAAYVPVVSATGLGWGAVATLLCTEAVLAARWWRAHRLPAGAPVRGELPAATRDLPAPDSDPLVRRWRAKLAGPDGRLAGSELYNGKSPRTACPTRSSWTARSTRWEPCCPPSRSSRGR
uniref:hypothetical protein n=1 Tax=Saccharothrix espanaensis TaxID=103731 RepID=UPI003F491215